MSAPLVALEDERSGWQRSLAVVSAIGPPVTVATALLIYFGWARTEAQASAMGLDSSLFGYTPQDYILRSVNSLVVPLVVLTLAAIGWLAADRWLQRQLEAGIHGRLIAGVAGAAAAAGILAAAAAGTVAVLAPLRGVVYAPLVMAAGVLTAAWGLRLRRRQRTAGSAGPAVEQRAVEASLVLALVTLLLFWGTSDIAQAAGRGLAFTTQTQLTSLPQVRLFSHVELGLSAPNVATERLGSAEAPLFQYSGLRLLVLSGGRFFLLNEGWTLAGGTVMVVDDTRDVRLEFRN